MSTETYQVIQVKGGKFHRPERVEQEHWFKPMLTSCGSQVTPLNVFSVVGDAISYCGGRTEGLCRKCFLTMNEHQS